MEVARHVVRPRKLLEFDASAELTASAPTANSVWYENKCVDNCCSIPSHAVITTVKTPSIFNQFMENKLLEPNAFYYE